MSEETTEVEQPNTVVNDPEGTEQNPQSDTGGEGKKKGVRPSDRIRHVVAQKNEYRDKLAERDAEIAELKKPKRLEKPKEENFENREDYLIQRQKHRKQEEGDIAHNAVEDYKNTEKSKNVHRSNQKIFNDYNNVARLEALEEYKNYDLSENAVEGAIRDFNAPNLRMAIMESSENKALVDYLGNSKNVNELDNLAELFKTSPAGAARKLGRLEAKLEKKLVKRPDQPNPLPKGGKSVGSVDKDPNEMNQKEYNIYKKNKNK